MRAQTFADWTVFNLGIVVAPRLGLFFGLGPFLIRILWGTPFFRCDDCGRKIIERSEASSHD